MDIFVLILQKTLVFAVPLLIVALGGMFAERSGVINLALEGQMIFGGFVGAIFALAIINADPIRIGGRVILSFTKEGNVGTNLLFILALLVAGISGALFSLLLSFSAIKLKADQTIGGTALNMLAPAIVCTVGLAFFNSEKVQMPVAFKGYAIINDKAPPLVRIFADKAYISTYLLTAVFILLSVWIYKTKVGTRMRACGEHPQAADSVGINVHKMRYLGTTISGFLAGMGGYAYIASATGGTAENTIGGMGFLALAIMIFGNWKPLGIALGALMFGFLKCLSSVHMQVSFLRSVGLPMYFYNIIPYLVVLIVLALTAKKSGVPKAEGIPYDKGTR